MSTDEKFEAKFKYLTEIVEKQSEDNSKLYYNLEKEIKTISTILSKKIQTSCKQFLQNLFIFCEKPKEDISSIDELITIPGYEEDFKRAKNEYDQCTNRYKSILDSISYNIETYNILSLHSHQLCLEQCKNEVRENKLIEADAKKCLNTCYGYKNNNALATYDIVIDTIENTKNLLNKI
jgi:hypothetical protein